MPDSSTSVADNAVAASRETSTPAPLLLANAAADTSAAAARFFLGCFAAWSDLATMPHGIASLLLDYQRRSRLLSLPVTDRAALADPLMLYASSVEAVLDDFGELRERVAEIMAERSRNIDRRWREETALAACALIAAREKAMAASDAETFGDAAR